MFKRMFRFSPSENDTPQTRYHNGSTGRSNGVVELASALQRESEKAMIPDFSTITGIEPAIESFDEVYAKAGIKAEGKTYTILKVAEMVNSKHLAEMTTETKRSSLLMALEAGAAEIGDLLQDAVTRQRALDGYEEERQNQLKGFEAAKEEENNKLQAELERLTGQYMSRIQANADQVAQEQDAFRAWQKRKQQESLRISDAATFCVPQGNNPNSSNVIGLTTVLERVSMARR